MSNHKYILVPTDLSDASAPAAARAKSLSDLSGAKIALLHVIDYLPPQFIATQLPEGFSTETDLVNHAREYLSDWADSVGLGDCGQIVKAGSAKREIVKTATEHEMDLIVMSSHGDRGLARIIGSTARGVLHDATCDVMVVHLD